MRSVVAWFQLQRDSKLNWSQIQLHFRFNLMSTATWFEIQSDFKFNLISDAACFQIPLDLSCTLMSSYISFQLQIISRYWKFRVLSIVGSHIGCRGSARQGIRFNPKTYTHPQPSFLTSNWTWSQILRDRKIEIKLNQLDIRYKLISNRFEKSIPNSTWSQMQSHLKVNVISDATCSQNQSDMKLNSSWSPLQHEYALKSLINST